MRTTTRLKELLDGTYPFTWGQVIGFHKIGRYDIVEFYSKEYKDSRYTGRNEDTSSFFIYVDGKEVSYTFHSLESAIVGAIAFGRMEQNKARHRAEAAQILLELEESK